MLFEFRGVKDKKKYIYNWGEFNNFDLYELYRIFILKLLWGWYKV